EGGMARVYLGRQRGDAGFARAVAIKRLHRQYARSPEFRSCLLDEARLASRIRHPNVVPILDVVAAKGELLLVMEYVIGEALADLMDLARERAEPIPVDVAVSVMQDVLQGLHAAHTARDSRGEPLHIGHRDLSPHNILVGRDGSARVFDFGVAKALGNAQLTRPGEIKGTLAYMSPEQMRARPVSSNSDVFSAGIVLWEMVASRDLFARDSDAATVSALLAADILPLRGIAGVPDDFDAVIARALSRDPARRYQDALEFARALSDCVRPASATRLTEWVQGLVGPELERRTRLLAKVEAQVSSPSAAPSAARPLPASTLAELAPRPKPATDTLTVVVIIVVAMAALWLALVFLPA